MIEIVNKKKVNWSLWIIISIIFGVGLLFFMHDDLMETSNHSYILLTDIFKGRFLDFYLDVEAHENDLYYINNANYNIFVYIIFALWQLPIELIRRASGLTMNEHLLWIWSKLLPCIFYWLCFKEVFRISKLLSDDNKNTEKASLVYLLSPISFFSAFIMGQYVTLCLLFMLLSIRLIQEDRYILAMLCFGIAVSLNLLTAFALLPIILVIENKIDLQFLSHLAIAFIPLIISSILFIGRKGSSKFSNEMLRRIMSPLVVGDVEIPFYPCVFAIICCCALLFSDDDINHRIRYGIYLSICSISCLFLFIEWHPQWIIVLIALIAIYYGINHNIRLLWPILSITLCVGFFFYCFFRFPGQLEINLIDDSVLYFFDIQFEKKVLLFSEVLKKIDAEIPIRMIAKALFSASLICISYFSSPFIKPYSADKNYVFEKYNELFIVFTFICAFCGYMLCIIFPLFV